MIEVRITHDNWVKLYDLDLQYWFTSIGMKDEDWQFSASYGTDEIGAIYFKHPEHALLFRLVYGL